MRIITIAAEKGGPGKTTTATNVAAGLAETGKTVLLVDLDPQGNAGMAFGLQPGGFVGKSTAELLMKETKLEEITVQVRDNLFLVPASRRLYEVQKILVGGRAVDRRLLHAMKTLVNVDFVIIDNPPGNTIIHDNAYMCSNEVIVPVETKLFSAKGLKDIKTTIGEIREDNPNIDITGIVITKVNENRVQDRSYREVIREQFGNVVFNAEIPETVRLSEAQGAGKTIYEYDRWGAAGLAYKRLCDEIVERGETNDNK
jgi:chromosome partitioning protein